MKQLVHWKTKLLKEFIDNWKGYYLWKKESGKRDPKQEWEKQGNKHDDNKGENMQIIRNEGSELAQVYIWRLVLNWTHQ